MGPFRDWATAVLGDEAGNDLADRYADALGRHLDAAIFHGTTPPETPNPFRRTMSDDYLGPKPMPRPETFARNIGPGAVPTEDLGGLFDRYAGTQADYGFPQTFVAGVDPNATEPPPVLVDMTEAERLGLVVGAAYGAALADRDQARAMAVALEGQLAEAIRLLDLAVHHWPETTWATDSKALEDLVQGIENLKAVESPENPETPKVDR